MAEKRTSVFENGLIWFGAAVSIAEILTGTYLAPLGFSEGLIAIILGHVIGCTMMFLAGLIGAKSRKSAMETVKMSFGQRGGILFSVLNVLQLVGWTAIMIYDGALAADEVLHTGAWLWCIVIGLLIILWIAVGVTNLGKLNTIAMAALFVLTLILCKVIFFNGDGASVISGEGMTFGAAVELSVAMPLSWLPVISDYTREAEKPVKATGGKRSRLWACELLDVCDRYGGGDLHRGDEHRHNHGKGRTWNNRSFNYRLLNGYHNIFGCLFRRRIQRIYLQEMEGKARGNCGDCDRNHCGDPISYG